MVSPKSPGVYQTSGGVASLDERGVREGQKTVLAFVGVTLLVALLFAWGAKRYSPDPRLVNKHDSHELTNVTGVVTNLDGSPVEGAEIVDGQASAGKTDATGRFHIAIAGPTDRLEVRARGYHTETIVPSGDGSDLQVVLDRVLDLRGRLLRAGVPEVNAQIDVATRGSITHVTSQADGRFRVAGASEGRTAVRAASADGKFAAFVVASLPAEELTMTLLPAVVLEGQLRDAEGPVVGEVALDELEKTALRRTAMSDKNGHFAISAVLPGKYLVSARTPDHLTIRAKAIAVASGDRFDLTMERGASLDGEVLDQQGSPVAGAAVQAFKQLEGGALLPLSGLDWDMPGSTDGRLEEAGELGILRGPLPFPKDVSSGLGSPSTATTTAASDFMTDGRGHFRLTGLPPGAVVVIVRHPKFAVSRSPSLLVSVTGPNNVRVVLEHADEFLEGEVRDARENPIGGVRVELESSKGAAIDDRQSAVTDRAGLFRIEHVTAGPHRGRAVHGDYAPAWFEGMPGKPVHIALGYGAGIEGEVRTRRLSSAPPGTKVELAIGSERIALLLDGRHFRRTGIPVGSGTLTIRAPGYVTWVRAVELPAAAHEREVTLSDLDCELELGGTVVGRVVDEDGREAGSVTVCAGDITAVSDRDGQFKLMGVPAGKIPISAEKGGRRVTDEVEVRANEDSRVELRLHE